LRSLRFDGLVHFKSGSAHCAERREGI
jgi:hypothetical protein